LPQRCRGQLPFRISRDQSQVPAHWCCITILGYRRLKKAASTIAAREAALAGRGQSGFYRHVHEIRTPIEGVLGWRTSLGEDLTANNAVPRHHAKQWRSVDLINDIPHLAPSERSSGFEESISTFGSYHQITETMGMRARRSISNSPARGRAFRKTWRRSMRLPIDLNVLQQRVA